MATKEKARPRPGGKWAKYRGQLEPFVGAPEWHAKVEAEMRRVLDEADEARGANPGWLGRQYVEVRREKERAKAELKEINVREEALVRLLNTAMEDDELNRVELADGVSLTLSDEPYPGVEDRQKLFAYIKRTGQTALLSVHFQTLRALVKAELESGRPAPPGVKIWLKTGIRPRGLRGAENGDDDGE